MSIPGFALGPYVGGSRGVGGGVRDRKRESFKTLEARERHMGEFGLDWITGRVP